MCKPAGRRGWGVTSGTGLLRGAERGGGVARPGASSQGRQERPGPIARPLNRCKLGSDLKFGF